MTWRIALSLVLSLCLSANASAQLASQTALVGTVTDSGGLVVPGAQIVAVNTGTKDTYEATTNAEGSYHIPFVRPGRYEITISIPSFQAFKVTGVDVATNQVVRTNATLQVGGVTESVNVSAEAQVLDTDRATVSETIGERAIVELPLSGRNVWSLASTTPGVLGGLNSDIGLSFRGAGQREIQNSLSLDGINASSNLLAATSMRPIADAVTEIQVQTGSTSAEYGAYLGVHINVVTKSGTNALHGTVFEFYQDSALDSRGYYENTLLPKNPRERNQFGGQMDGPVVIPGLYNGRNKTFFMGAYEGVRGEATTSPFGSVPTEAMRRGDFSAITTPIRNPFTGQNFAGNIIPSSMISPTSRELLQYYPEANRAGTANNLQLPSANTDNVDQVLARVDQNLGNKIRLNVRYNWHDSFNANIGNAVIPVTAVTQPRVNKNWLFSYTHTLRPNLLNDFRIGYHRIDFDTVNPFYVDGPADAGTALGIPGFNGDTAFNNPGLPSINVSNFNCDRDGRGELVPVRYDLPGLERARLQPRLAQHPLRLRSAADGDRPASRQRSARALRLHRRDQRLLGRRLHAGPAAHGHPPDGSNPGSRRRVAQRVLRQRYLAGDAQPDLEHRSALRADHARPDIRGPGVDACGRPGNDYPEHIPQQGLRVHRGELRLRPPSWRDISARREDGRPRRLRDLLQPESDELVHVPDQ